MCSKTITFDGLGVQVGADVAARFGPMGGQDNKNGGLGSQGAAAEWNETWPGRCCKAGSWKSPANRMKLPEIEKSGPE